MKKVKPEYALIEGDPTQTNELIPQGMDTSSFSPSSSYSSIPSSDPDPTKNYFMYVCKKKLFFFINMRKWKNERGRSKGREDNNLDQNYFHLFF